MAGFLARLVEEAELGRPHIVAPDVGTPAGTLRRRRRDPELFAGLVVGTGATAIPLELGEPLASWVLDPDLERYRAMDPRAIIDVAADTVAGGIPDEIREDYKECYAGERFVQSMLFARRYPEQLPELAELLPGIETPVTILCGSHDRVVPLANAEFLDARLPNSSPRGHRCRPLRLGGGAGAVRVCCPRVDQEKAGGRSWRAMTTTC